MAFASALVLSAFACLQEAPSGAGLPEGVSFGAAAADVRPVDAPRLLAGDIELQWGGQNFSYLLEGERGLFWTALRYVDDETVSRPIVGQAPKDGSGLPVLTTELPIPQENLYRVAQPQLLRTPDGYLHVFVGYYTGRPSCGRMVWFRSAKPEDASEFVAVGELPLGGFVGFQIRENVALTRDGERMVLAIMSCFAEGKHLINTPLIFFGQREGLDFRFQDPIAYDAPTPFFYPLIAATDGGVVMLGSVHNEDDTQRSGLLMHVDWRGRLLKKEFLPTPAEPGNYYAHALQPFSPDDWSRLAIMRACVPHEGTVRTAEFWTYDVEARALSLARSVENDFSLVRSITNAGDFLPRRGGPPLFFNNPASRSICAWEGDLFGAGALRICPLPNTQPFDLGFRGSRSVYVPNVLQGSVIDDHAVHVAADVTNADMQKGHRGPCSMLVWRLELD